MSEALTFDSKIDKFHVSNLPSSEIGKTDALVKISACSLNPVNAKIVQWMDMAHEMENA